MKNEKISFWQVRRYPIFPQKEEELNLELENRLSEDLPKILKVGERELTESNSDFLGENDELPPIETFDLSAVVHIKTLDNIIRLISE